MNIDIIILHHRSYIYIYILLRRIYHHTLLNIKKKEMSFRGAVKKANRRVICQVDSDSSRYIFFYEKLLKRAIRFLTERLNNHGCAFFATVQEPLAPLCSRYIIRVHACLAYRELPFRWTNHQSWQRDTDCSTLRSRHLSRTNQARARILTVESIARGRNRRTIFLLSISFIVELSRSLRVVHCVLICRRFIVFDEEGCRCIIIYFFTTRITPNYKLLRIDS